MSSVSPRRRRRTFEVCPARYLVLVLQAWRHSLSQTTPTLPYTHRGAQIFLLVARTDAFSTQAEQYPDTNLASA